MEHCLCLHMYRLPSVPVEERGGRRLRKEAVGRGMGFRGCNGLLGFGNCEMVCGQAASAGPCQKPQAGLTKALPWQVGEGMSALILQPGEGPLHTGWARLCKETEMKVEPQ